LLLHTWAEKIIVTSVISQFFAENWRKSSKIVIHSIKHKHTFGSSSMVGALTSARTPREASSAFVHQVSGQRLRPDFNNISWPKGVNFVHYRVGLFIPSFTPSCENSIMFRRTNGRTEGLHPRRITSPIGDQLHPWGVKFCP
jgi:hypothetical protein